MSKIRRILRMSASHSGALSCPGRCCTQKVKIARETACRLPGIFVFICIVRKYVNE